MLFKMTRVLSFFPVFRDNRFGLTFSGGERRFIEICKVWSTLGIEIHIITTSYGERLLKEFDYNTETHIYQPLILKGIGLQDFINGKRMLLKIPAEKFDFIYAPGELFNYVVTSIAAKRKLKIPVVASFNLFDPNESKLSNYFLQTLLNIFLGRKEYPLVRAFPRGILLVLKNYIRNFNTRSIDLFFSVGSEVKKTLTASGISGERIFIVSAGIDFTRIQKIKHEEKIYDACFMGQIIPRKGITDLIESWKIVVKAKSDAKLVIMGRGPQNYETKIINLIREYKLQDNITLLGFVLGDEKYRIMKRSKLFIFPSYLETFGQAICEAMACELPIIAYYLPVYDEWYGDIILRVDKGDRNNLALSILNLLENKELRSKMGYEGRSVASQYSWEGVAKYQLEIINTGLLP